jgi:hypothetical protein
MTFLQELLSDKVSTGRGVMISESEYRYTVLLLMTCLVIASMFFAGLIAVAMMKESRR